MIGLSGRLRSATAEHPLRTKLIYSKHGQVLEGHCDQRHPERELKFTPRSEPIKFPTGGLRSTKIGRRSPELAEATWQRVNHSEERNDATNGEQEEIASHPSKSPSACPP